MAQTKIRPPTSPEEFYGSALKVLTQSEGSFMLAGAYALGQYTGIVRDTKDLDVFCTPGDYPGLLEALSEAGYQTEITDANWIAKAYSGDYYVDLIFNSANGIVRVEHSWYERATQCEAFGAKINLIPVTEMVWSKLYIADRYRYDGADVNHLILKQAENIDWARLLECMDRDWELLYAHLLTFRFAYPSEGGRLPRWLMDELAHRLNRQLNLPAPQDPVCRGPLLTRTEYQVDIDSWGFKTT